MKNEGIKEYNSFAIWCEHPFAIYSALLIVKKYREQSKRVIIYTNSKCKEYAMSYLDFKEDEIIIIDKYQSKKGARLTRLFELLFVPLDFSPVFKKRKTIKWTKRELRISQFFSFLKIKGSKVNKTYQKWIKFFTTIQVVRTISRPEPDLLISFTKTYVPYLLSQFKCRHISIMESWDHPGKEPYLIYPDVHLCWNDDLCRETSEIQGLKKTGKICPLKFRYIEEYSSVDTELIFEVLDKVYQKDLSYLKENDCLVYPMCTSSDYYAFEGEVKFVKDLAEAVGATGKKLYIRPYPIAPIQDAEILNNINNVFVGLVSTVSNGANVLNEQENKHKYLLMKYSAAVINVGTTFAFDAALVGSPVYQLQLHTEKYGIFSSYSHGEHIKKYLWNENNFSFEGEIQKLKEVFIDSKKSKNFSNYLINWINPV
jgi:hypothetical protein